MCVCVCVCVCERERHLLLSVTYQKDSITHHEINKYKDDRICGKIKTTRATLENIRRTQRRS